MAPDRRPARDPAAVREAVPADLPRLVQLRSLLFSGPAAGWGRPPRAGRRDACAERLAAGHVRVVVIDGDGTWPGRPGSPRAVPASSTGGCRAPRREGAAGHARAIVTALLEWFDDRGLTRVDPDTSAARPGDAPRPLTGVVRADPAGTVAGWKAGG